MRKTIALLLSLMMIMMFALASCGGGSETFPTVSM